MSTCILRKASDVVNDNNLPKFGFVKALVANSVTNLGYNSYVYNEHIYHGVAESTSENLKFSVGGTLSSSMDSTSWQSAIQLTGTTPQYVLWDVYKSTNIVGWYDFDEDFPSSDTLCYLSFGQGNDQEGVYHQSKFELTALRDRFPNLKVLDASYGISVVKGVLSDICKCTKLEVLKLRSTYTTGSLEELATGMITNGRTSGTLEVTCGPNITYNDTIVGDNVTKTITFANGSYSIS